MSEPVLNAEAPRRYGKFNRIDIIDATRGVCIMLMIIYHLHVDFYTVGLIPASVMYLPVFNWLQRIFAGIFILMSGMSSRMSRSNWKRGIKMLAGGLVVTLVTYFMNPGYFVKFGILHFLGAAALIFWLLRPLIDKIPRAVQPFLWIPLYVLAWIFCLDKTYDVQWLAWLGFRSASFASSDYFPILPHIFLYFFGTWLGYFVIEDKMPRWFYNFKCRWLAFVGKNTLWVYLLHQPVCYGIALLWALCKGVI